MYEALPKKYEDRRATALRTVSVYLRLSLGFVLGSLLSWLLIIFDRGVLVLFVVEREGGNRVMF